MDKTTYNILMVCLGNICRSPLAEGILRAKAPKTVTIDSAGTAGYHVGNPPDPRSVAVAKNRGIDIGMQRCRRFEKQDFQQFDLILVMDKSNYLDILEQAENEDEKNKVRLLLREVSDGPDEVPDPYYGGEQGFEYVYDLIDKACDALLERLKNEKKI